MEALSAGREIVRPISPANIDTLLHPTQWATCGNHRRRREGRLGLIVQRKTQLRHQSLNINGFQAQKRRHWTSFFVPLVGRGGFELCTLNCTTLQSPTTCSLALFLPRLRRLFSAVFAKLFRHTTSRQKTYLIVAFCYLAGLYEIYSIKDCYRDCNGTSSRIR